jgi:NADH:ubiquinone oxidoreductase subunit 5 (subunit L)/multisubunit Na+/H+ antiporter MnhA subunit
MEQLLLLFIFIPLLGFILTFFFANNQEKLIAAIATSTIGLNLTASLGLIVYWLFIGAPILDLKYFTFFKEDNIEIFLDLYFDKITAVYALVGSLITFLVIIFSRFYLHRDEGYKRFFSTVLLFFLGYNITVFSGNFETLFIGWEFLGITSFLLIAFYRDRYLPVKNALKAISLFRLGDICLILSLWTSHHIWHQNITFNQLNDTALVLIHIADNHNSVLFLISMLIVAAAIKSAQFPFSSWLPRAMEGPTTSSAIFYGSLSVHLGVFLLLRTYTYWSTITTIKLIVICVGVLTIIIASLIARVQSTVKTQIAYASIAQIGIMFIEVALGWHILALVHFSGNAFLRTYQLLVSPSVLGYMIHDQFFNFKKPHSNNKLSKFQPIYNSLYLLSVKEWNMDSNLKMIFWNPFKMIGKKMNFLSNQKGIGFMFAFLIVGLLLLYFESQIPATIDLYLHLLFAMLGTLLILVSFAEKKNAMNAWILLSLSQGFAVLSIAHFNDKYESKEILIYITGLMISSVVGYVILSKLKKEESKLSLDNFYGHVYHYPKLGFGFLVTCLAFVGLPFTPSFIGIDLMFSHVDHDEYLLIILTSISFLVLELAVLRIYARLFLGPNQKQDHPIAYRSS